MNGVTLTGRQLMEAVPGLRLIGERDLTPSGAYMIAKTKRKTEDALRDLEVARKQLLGQFAVKDGNGVLVTLPDQTADFPSVAARAEFDKAFTVLLAQPITLSGIRPISLDEIADSITPDTLFSLGPLVEEPPTPDASK